MSHPMPAALPLLTSKIPLPGRKSAMQKSDWPQIFAVGGGKGGVGKTVVTLALGISLANLGKKVVLVDADFGGANLHTCLNIMHPPLTLKDFFERKFSDINQITMETPFNNLKVICGAPGVLGMAHFMYWEKLKLMRHLRKLQADFIILDLGGGSAFNEVDLFLAADKSILVSNVNGVALKESFNFIKIALFRKLQHVFRECPEVLTVLTEYVGPSRTMKPVSVAQMLQDLQLRAENWLPLVKNAVDEFRPNFILNMMTEADDAEEAQALRNVTGELLGVYLNYWGGIHYDENIRRAIRTVKPELLLGANGPATADLLRIVKRNVLTQEKLPKIRPRRLVEANNLALDADPGSNIRICTYRCIAWNCCSARVGGLPCSVTSATASNNASLSA